VKIEASFVRSATVAGDFPRDGAPLVALVGRSNVGKSSLINALVRRRLARTSAAPGKTRLANIYRVAHGGRSPLYLVDLPGYGYAHGDRSAFERIAATFFRDTGAALLLVDARHPGLENDLAAWNWLGDAVATRAIVATKIDKLSRAERLRAIRDIEAVFEHPATAVSAETGEGLEELWKLIERLTK
jgi:GTP-binding protein